MARRPQPAVAAHDLQGFKYLKMVMPLLARLHDAGCARDRAGNRRLFYDPVSYTHLTLPTTERV